MSLTAIGFLLLYGAAAVRAFVRGPIWGLLLYVAVLYLHPVGRWWGADLPGLRWSLMTALITLVAYLAHREKLTDRPAFLSHGPVRAVALLTVWIAIQTPWALSFEEHTEFLVLYVKYLILMYLMYRILDSPEAVRLFLWAHVAGCFVMGWNAFQTYTGGRFEGFVPPNLNEANSGGLALVTGLAAAGALFLWGTWKERAILLFLGVFIANGIVTTQSRSTFLAAGVVALSFNWLVPRRHRWTVRLWSLAAVVGFLLLTNPQYWERISTLKEAGEQVEGVDTGYGRVVLAKAQWEMFKANPLGWGHRGTAKLSPLYLEDRFLTGTGENRGRSSHNTFLSLLVEQGVVGAAIYVYLVWWLWRSIVRTRRLVRGMTGFLPLAFTASASILLAIFVGDMFVDYLKIEQRLWFLTILLLIPMLARRELAGNEAAAGAVVGRPSPAAGRPGSAPAPTLTPAPPARRGG